MISTSGKGGSVAHETICHDIKDDQEHPFNHQVNAAEVKHSNSHIQQECHRYGLWEPDTVNTKHMPTSST